MTVSLENLTVLCQVCIVVSTQTFLFPHSTRPLSCPAIENRLHVPSWRIFSPESNKN